MSDAAFDFADSRRALLGFAGRLVGFTLLATLMLIWLGPVLLVVLTSVKSNNDFLAGPFALPSHLTFEPYLKVWFALGFGPLMANSFLYATARSKSTRLNSSHLRTSRMPSSA